MTMQVSYSSAWWDWDRWQQEIDWMAMSGNVLMRVLVCCF